MEAKIKFFDFYINSSIHVAFAVVSLTIITGLHLHLPPDGNLLVFIFCGTVTGYNFVKYGGLISRNQRNLSGRLKAIQYFTGFTSLGLLVSAFLVRPGVLLWSAFFGVFTILYAFPLFRKRRNLRSIAGIKIFIIAFVWAGVTVMLPMIPLQDGLLVHAGSEFMQRFLLVVVWILPFEIRDLKYDLEQLGTLPQRMGVVRTKLFGIFLLLVVILLEHFKETANIPSLMAVIIICCLSGLLLWLAKEQQGKYYSAFWVEGIPLLWVGLLWLFQRF